MITHGKRRAGLILSQHAEEMHVGNVRRFQRRSGFVRQHQRGEQLANLMRQCGMRLYVFGERRPFTAPIALQKVLADAYIRPCGLSGRRAKMIAYPWIRRSRSCHEDCSPHSLSA